MTTLLLWLAAGRAQALLELAARICGRGGGAA